MRSAPHPRSQGNRVTAAWAHRSRRSTANTDSRQQRREARIPTKRVGAWINANPEDVRQPLLHRCVKDCECLVNSSRRSRNVRQVVDTIRLSLTFSIVELTDDGGGHLGLSRSLVNTCGFGEIRGSPGAGDGQLHLRDGVRMPPEGGVDAGKSEMTNDKTRLNFERTLHLRFGAREVAGIVMHRAE